MSEGHQPSQDDPSHYEFRRQGKDIASIFGYRLTEFGDGKCAVEWRPSAPFVNSGGGVWGGAVAAVVDNVCAMAVVADMPTAPRHLPTVSMHVDYLRALMPDSLYVVRGETLRVGGRLAVADAHVLDADGVLCARATCTYAIRR